MAQSGSSGRFTVAELTGMKIDIRPINVTSRTTSLPVTSLKQKNIDIDTLKKFLSLDVTGKVDKVSGKDLSTNDFTNPLKTKLDGIATGATANSTDAYLLSRTNQTGTQAISTVTNLQSNLDAKFDKTGGNVTGYVGIGNASPGFPLDVSGTINSTMLSIQGFPVVQDNGYGDIATNTRIIRNKSLGISSGLYIGYGNALSAPTRIYDGGTANALLMLGGIFSTTGFTKFLFGNQTDDNTFTQFSGNVHVKASGYFDTNVGIGTISPVSKLSVSSGDVEAETVGNGVIIKSPNGIRWRITISNTGNLSVTSL